MHQVLFYIPLKSLWDALPDIPIHGWGAMLFFAFVLCLWLAVRLGRREGISKETIQDIAIWLIAQRHHRRSRSPYMIQYGDDFLPFWDFYKLWDGGMVFYGGLIGGVIGYYLAYFIWLRKRDVSNWKMADVLAPCGALGLALGRFGCLLNGCCFGNVACTDSPAMQAYVEKPGPSLSHCARRRKSASMVERGHQYTRRLFGPGNGFSQFQLPHNNEVVRAVEPGSRPTRKRQGSSPRTRSKN